MHKKTEKTKRGRGRPPKTASDLHGARAVCWLASDQKAALQAHAAESGRSESALLCAGLVATGVLAERGTNPANRDTETTPEPG